MKMGSFEFFMLAWKAIGRASDASEHTSIFEYSSPEIQEAMIKELQDDIAQSKQHDIRPS